MRILITGCNGQLGNEMQLLEEENPQHTYFNTDVAELDITDQQAVEKYVDDNEIDGIVNCAAYTAVDKAEDNKELCTTLNTVAPAYLAAAIEKRGGWMIQISTDYVFDGTKHTPYVETDTPCPDSVYGSTKLAGELGVTKFCKKAMIIRTAWLYSTFGNNFVKTMIRLGKEKPELGVIFDHQSGGAAWRVPLLERGCHLVVRLHEGHPPHCRHHDLPCAAPPYGRVSHTRQPSALLRARQDKNQTNLWYRGALLGGEPR